MRVLLVEDDEDLRELAAAGLGRRGYTVDTARTLREAMDAARTVSYDCLVVDRGLPDGDGISLSRSGRAPVIFLTALSSIQDRVDGLDSGADDYLTKPFDLDELAARIRAIGRKPGPRKPPSAVFGKLEFDPAHQEARICGKRLAAGRRELALLALLLSEAPRTVTRDRIEDRLYNFDEAVTPNAVEAVVSRLRKRIEPAGVTITAARGIGWRLEEI